MPRSAQWCSVAWILASIACGLVLSSAAVLAQDSLNSTNATSPAETLASLRQRVSEERSRYRSDERTQRVLKLDRQILSHPDNVGELLVRDLGLALEMSSDDDTFELCQRTLAAHPKDWQVRLAVAGYSKFSSVDFGYWPSNEGLRLGSVIHRGFGFDHSDSDEWIRVSFEEHDRVWRIQLLLEAIELMRQDASATQIDQANAFESLASRLEESAWYQSGDLSKLTDLQQLPAPVVIEEAEWAQNRRSLRLDDQGYPLGLRLPASWQESKTDRERFHWALEQAAKLDPARRSRVEMIWIEHLDSLVGISESFPERAPEPNAAKPYSSGAGTGRKIPVSEIRSLSDSETYVPTPEGPKRISLDPEINPFVLLQRIVERDDDQRRNAVTAILQMRVNRYQLRQVAEALQTEITLLESRLASMPQPANSEHQKALENELSVRQRERQALLSTEKDFYLSEALPGITSVVKKGTLPITLNFRNATSATFRFQSIDLEKLLTTQLAGALPESTDSSASSWRKREELLEKLYQGCGRLDDVERAGLTKLQLLSPMAKELSVPLTPLPEHEMTSVTIDIPVPQPLNAWVLTVGEGDAVEDSWLYWQAPAAFQLMPLAKSGYVGFLADRISGKAIPDAEVELAYLRKLSEPPEDREIIATLVTDQNGLFTLPADIQRGRHGMIVCRREGRIVAAGYLPSSEDSGHERAAKDLELRLADRPKSFIVTDRTVYRPGDTVHIHFWAGKPFGELDLIPKQGPAAVMIAHEEDSFIIEGQHDESRGFTAEWKIPIDVRTGDYEIKPTVQRAELGDVATIRIEEYRRPEFSVKLVRDDVLPSSQAQQIRVEASYLFGKPVSSGHVHWKLVGQIEPVFPFPLERWDSFYGNGYAWFATSRRHAAPPWDDDPWSAASSPGSEDNQLTVDSVDQDFSKLIRGDAELGDDGTCVLTLQQLATLQKVGFNAIEVEVTDLTRRMEKQSLALPVKTAVALSVKTDRRYCRQNETIQVTAATLDISGNPIERDCVVDVLVMSADGKESLVPNAEASRKIRTTPNGRVTFPQALIQPGLIKLRVALADDARVVAETNIIVLPEAGLPDSPIPNVDLRTEFVENSAGSTINLLISGPTEDATVLLFLRPFAGFVENPQVLQLDGHSLIVPVELKQDDFPGFYVEAVMMADGEMTSVVRKVLVPPVRQRLDLELRPVQQHHKPGDEVELQLTALDSSGKPAAVNVVIAAYDESLDQVVEPQTGDIVQRFYDRPLSHYAQGMRSRDLFSYWLPDTLLITDRQLIWPYGAQFFGSQYAGNPVHYSAGGGFGGGGGLGGGGMGGGGMISPGMSGLGGGMSLPEPTAASISANTLSLPSGPFVDPRLRSSWRDTAFFSADLQTDREGHVTARLTLPDNLTTWKVRAWAKDDQIRVGYVEQHLQVSRDIMIRPHVPRHLTSGDEITISAAIYSSLETEKTCRVSLKTGNDRVRLPNNSVQDITLAPKAEAIVHWTIVTDSFGDADLTISAQTDEDADAAQLTVPINPRGKWSNTARFASITDSTPQQKMTFDIPADRFADKSQLELRWGTTVSDSVLEALPFLIEYPHGCAEQTTNRFVPLALAHNAANEFPQLRFESTRLRQEGRPSETRDLPDEPTFHRMLQAGRSRLEELQNIDGGWSWFGTPGVSSPDLTAQVAYGLFLAMSTEDRFTDSHQRGIHFLTNHLAQRRTRLAADSQATATDTDVWLTFVALQIHELANFDMGHDVQETCEEILKAVHRDAKHISSLGIVLAGLAAESLGDKIMVREFLEKAEPFLVRDAASETIWIQNVGIRRGGWFEGASETMGRYLQLKLRNDMNDPDIDWIVRGLLLHRRSTMSWENTRDTAVVIEAMIELLKTRNTAATPPEFDVLLDGKPIETVRATGEELRRRTELSLDATKLTPGPHTVEVRRVNGPDFEAILVSREFSSTVTSGDDQGPLRIERRFFRVRSESSKSNVGGTNDERSKSDRVELAETDSISAGDIIEVELTVTLQSDIEYLMLQSPHAAGFEVHHLNDQFLHTSYHELRDDRLDLYFESLTAGTYSFAYQLRAEHTGRLWFNPASFGSMYYDQMTASSPSRMLLCR